MMDTVAFSISYGSVFFIIYGSHSGAFYQLRYYQKRCLLSVYQLRSRLVAAEIFFFSYVAAEIFISDSRHGGVFFIVKQYCHVT